MIQIRKVSFDVIFCCSFFHPFYLDVISNFSLFVVIAIQVNLFFWMDFLLYAHASVSVFTRTSSLMMSTLQSPTNPKIIPWTLGRCMAVPPTRLKGKARERYYKSFFYFSIAVCPSFVAAVCKKLV